MIWWDERMATQGPGGGAVSSLCNGISRQHDYGIVLGAESEAAISGDCPNSEVGGAGTADHVLHASIDLDDEYLRCK